MDDVILAVIRGNIDVAKGEELNYCTYCEEIPDGVKVQLESEGYSVKRVNHLCYIIRWNERKGKTSGKMSIEMILEFLAMTANRSNIL